MRDVKLQAKWKMGLGGQKISYPLILNGAKGRLAFKPLTPNPPSPFCFFFALPFFIISRSFRFLRVVYLLYSIRAHFAAACYCTGVRRPELTTVALWSSGYGYFTAGNHSQKVGGGGGDIYIRFASLRARTTSLGFTLLVILYIFVSLAG